MRPAPEVRTFIVVGTAITWLAAALTLPYVAGTHTAAVAVAVLAVPAVLSPVVTAALTTLWIRPAWGVIGWLTLEFVVITIVVAYSCLVWLGLEQQWQDRRTNYRRPRNSSGYVYHKL